MPFKNPLLILLLAQTTTLSSQYDPIISSLKLPVTTSPTTTEGYFEQKHQNSGGTTRTYFDFSNPDYDFYYFPKQATVDCGYFMVNNQKIEVENKYPHNLGCDLDYGSFELFELQLGNKNYLILTAIRYSSGTASRYVYCNLFDVSQPANVVFYPLWSQYGSQLCFGDYNADNILDFLEIRYDPKRKDDDVFRLTFSTLSENVFERDADRYIVFKRWYGSDYSLNTTILEDHW